MATHRLSRRITLGFSLVVLLSAASATTAHARLDGASEREMMATILGAIPDEAKKDRGSAMFYCYAVYFKIVAMPRQPADLVAKYKASCYPLIEGLPRDVAGVAAALDAHGAIIEREAQALYIPPIGPAYDASRAQHELIISATKRGKDAVALASAFVAALPHPQAINRATFSADVKRRMTLRARDLWTIALGPIFAGQMNDSQVVPHLIKTIDAADNDADKDNHASINLAIDEMKASLDLLRAAAPEHDKIEATEARIKALAKAADKAYEKLVAKTRMPEGHFKGSGRDGLVATVKKVAGRHYKAVLRVVFTQDGWSDPVTRGRFDEFGTLTWGTWSSLTGAAAVETEDAGVMKYRVLPFTMTRKLSYKSGSYSAPVVSLGGWAQPILKQNISK